MKRLLIATLFFASFGVANADMVCRDTPRGRICTAEDDGVMLCSGVKYYPSSRVCWVGWGTAHHRPIFNVDRVSCDFFCTLRDPSTIVTVGAGSVPASPSPFMRLLDRLGIGTPAASPASSAAAGTPASSFSASRSTGASASPRAASAPPTPAGYVSRMIAVTPPTPIAAPLAAEPSEEHMRTMSGALALTCNGVTSMAAELFMELRRQLSVSEAWTLVNRRYSGVCNGVSAWEERNPAGRWEVWKCDWRSSSPGTGTPPPDAPSRCVRKRIRPPA